MTEGTYKAILLSSVDYKESDKLLRLLTPDEGVITAIMRGVKKPTAKMRFGAVPFAFCEYSLKGRGSLPIVTGCTQIENLFAISEDYDKYAISCLMLEVASIASEHEPNPQIFISLLRALRLILYSDLEPIIIATSFIQSVIHECGYAYEYPPPPAEVDSVMGLLSLLSSLRLIKSSAELTLNSEFSSKVEVLYKIPKSLSLKTLIKLIQNFEKKFDASIKSSKLVKELENPS